jgi:hypothetical protein
VFSNAVSSSTGRLLTTWDSTHPTTLGWRLLLSSPLDNEVVDPYQSPEWKRDSNARDHVKLWFYGLASSIALMVIVWSMFWPVVAFSLRLRKRRITLGAIMAWIACFGVLIATITRQWPSAIGWAASIGLLCAPMIPAGLYFPRRWDVFMIATWILLWCSCLTGFMFSRMD